MGYGLWVMHAIAQSILVDPITRNLITHNSPSNSHEPFPRPDQANAPRCQHRPGQRGSGAAQGQQGRGRARAQAEPAHRARAHRAVARRSQGFLRAGPLGGTQDVSGLGRHARRRIHLGHRPRLRPALHDRRERREREGRRVFPADRQEGDPHPAHRLRMQPARALSGRFRRRLPADAGRDFSGRGRLRPHLPQQRHPLRGRHAAVRRHHGQLRRRRRLPARALRQDSHDRGQRALSRRPVAGEGGHRPGGGFRGTRRRADARRDQRHR